MITIHHLRIGRSIFTVWLLEELGLPYEAKIYDRHPQTMRAPAELRAVHPLGKSPVIVDDGMVISESGAIASYLVDRYDTANALAPPASDIPARTKYTQWLHYPEGSAFLPLMLKLLTSRMSAPPPELVAFMEPEIELHLGYIRDSLGDQPFILGDRFQAPDVGLTYVIDMAGRFGLLSAYPSLSAYAERNRARPAFVRAVAKVQA